MPTHAIYCIECESPCPADAVACPMCGHRLKRTDLDPPQQTVPTPNVDGGRGTSVRVAGGMTIGDLRNRRSRESFHTGSRVLIAIMAGMVGFWFGITGARDASMWGVATSTADVLCVASVSIAVCGSLGSLFGNMRGRSSAGFWSGLLLGPFGVVAAVMLPRPLWLVALEQFETEQIRATITQ